MPSMPFRPADSAASSRKSRSTWLAASLLLGLFVLCFASFAQRRQQMGLHPETPVPSQPVTVIDDGTSFILSNGYLTATINKKTGDMTSLKVYGLETQATSPAIMRATGSRTPTARRAWRRR